jgi:predicted RNase H-like nuclease (RuvC/YqgF family)
MMNLLLLTPKFKREIERWIVVTINKQKKNEDKNKLLKLVDEYRAQRKRSADQ